MMRVALVLPSSDEKRSSAISQAGAEHLGLGYIAAYLRAAGHHVDIFNLQVDNYLSYWELAEDAPARTPDETVAQILAARPDLVGMSITGITINEALKMSYRMKELRPDLPIVWGGHQAFYSARDLMEREPCVDAVVASDGEITMGRMLEALSAGEPLETIPGLYLRSAEGRMRYTGPPPEPPLDELPEPARDTLEEMISRGLHVTDARITTSRGCPFKCTFCVDPSLGYRNKWRARSAELVVAEMRHLVDRYGIEFFWFSEDNFIPSTRRGRARAARIADLIMESGMKIGYRALMRADAIKGERALIEKMMDSGLSCVYIGVESGSPRRLEYFKKQETPEEYRSVLEMLRETRVGLQVGFIMFDPLTTWEDLRIDGRFLHSVGQMYLYSNYCQTLDVFPGTEISMMLIQRRLLAADFSYDSPYDEYDWEIPAIGLLGRAFMRGYTEEHIEADKLFQRFAVVDVPGVWRSVRTGERPESVGLTVQGIADQYLGELNDAGLRFFSDSLVLAESGWDSDAFDARRKQHLEQTLGIRDRMCAELTRRLPDDVVRDVTCLRGAKVGARSEFC